MEQSVAAAANQSIWAVLWPVVVGGAIGILAGLIPQLAGHFLGRRAAKEDLRRQRFEEMMTALSQHHHWLLLRRDRLVFGEAKPDVAPPFQQARVICGMYFPALEKKIMELDLAAQDYELWMIEAGKRRLQGKYDSLSDGMAEAYRPYRSKFADFQQEAYAYAKDRFGLSHPAFKK